MGLRAWLDKSPMVAAGCIVLTSGGVTFAVTSYVHDRETNGLQREHRVAKEQLEARLAGIVRRVGPEERAVFDVSRLIVPASSIGPSYRSLGEGTIFVDAPTDGGWSYSLTSEAELKSETFPGLPDIPGLQPLLSERNVHLWRQSGAIILTGQGGPFIFFPMVMVQVLDTRRVEDALARNAAGNQAPLVETNERAAQRALDRLLVSPASGQPGESQQEIEQIWSSLFRGNLALRVLVTSLQGSMATGVAIPNAHQEVAAIEKRDNVIYLQSRLAARGNRQGGPAVIVTETFILTTPTKTIYVRSVVPSRDGRSDAFQWVTRFLAGLRIPREGG